MRHRINRLHFVGIGGTGMSGIAEVLHNLEYKVTGSDLVESSAVLRLRKLGIQVEVGHAASHIQGADAVVISTAVDQHNVEVAAARTAGLPVVPRATMLNELLRLRQGIAVAGSHGKTTITSMIASVLHEGGLDPTYVVGGLVRRFGNSAGLGKGEFIVVESDESDGSFLHLSPVIAVASNIDTDHLQTYGQDMRQLKRAFVSFFNNLPFYGVAVLCHDDSQLRDVGALISRRIISYGIANQEVDFHAHDIRMSNEFTTFRLEAPYGAATLRLNLIGEHNVLNALAALAVAHEVNVKPQVAAAGLVSFTGVKRRLECHGQIKVADKCAVLIDDYGHHPTEIAATLAALRNAYPQRSITLVFQPHRYTRMRDLFDAFVDILVSVDTLLITDVYAAGEEPLPNANSEALVHAIHLRGKKDVIFVPDLDDIPVRLAAVLMDGDVVVTMGAGTISDVAEELVRRWSI